MPTESPSRSDTPDHAAVMLATRPATQADAQVILAFDEVAQSQRQRVNFIYRAISARQCHVVTADRQVIGYAVLEYSFFEHGFISMLYVHSEHRRRGAAGSLLRHVEQQCRTPRLFTIVDADNAAFRDLLARHGYKPSGIIENLRDADPVHVYCKQVRAAPNL